MVLLVAHLLCNSMVRKGGLEPPHLSVPDPKSGASANSATFAKSNHPRYNFARIACVQDLSHKRPTLLFLQRSLTLSKTFSGAPNMFANPRTFPCPNCKEIINDSMTT